MHSAITSAGRRRLLRVGLAAPAVLAALRFSPAFADHDDHDHDHDDDDEHHDEHQQAPPPPQAIHGPFTADLVSVPQASANGDFTSSNPGSDPLVDGHITLPRRADSSSTGHPNIMLRGAAPSVSYDVAFQPFNTAKGREGLGTIGPTTSRGDLHAQTPNTLTGTSRVGVFVLTRTNDGSAQAGKEEFVSTLGG
jgi:hypothetical protein